MEHIVKLAGGGTVVASVALNACGALAVDEGKGVHLVVQMTENNQAMIDLALSTFKAEAGAASAPARS